MIHLFVGPDRYLVEHEVARLLAAYDPDRLNTTRFDKSADLVEIANAVATVGFFGSGRVIVAEGVMARVSGTAKGKKTDAEAVSKLLSEVAPDNHLLLIDTELAAIPRAIIDAAPKGTAHFSGASPRGNELVRWTQDKAKELGSSIEQKAVPVLLNKLFPGRWMRSDKPQYDAPPSLALLASTLEKLVLYADGRPISADDIHAMVPAETSDQLFAFTDSVFAGDTASSLRMLINEGLDDDSAARLLAYVGTQSELALIVALAGRDTNPALLGKELGGASEGRLARLRNSVSQRSAERVGQDFASADRRLKTGRVRGVQGQLHDLLISRSRKERGR